MINKEKETTELEESKTEKKRCRGAKTTRTTFLFTEKKSYVNRSIVP